MKLCGLSQNCPGNHCGYSWYRHEIGVLFQNGNLNLFLKQFYLRFQMFEFFNQTPQFQRKCVKQI
jgi:hypothetical protein